MAKILENKIIANDIYLMKVSGKFSGRVGQFYMVRGWDKYPILSRPISIHDINEDSISFLYQVKGEGTKILKSKNAGEDVMLEGPYGNGFPNVSGSIAIVGGGIGIAPLLYTVKKLSRNNLVDVYLGFNKESYLVDDFKKFSNKLTYTTKGFITDEIKNNYDYVLTCGPDLMMKKVYELFKETNTVVYVSTERHMACGIGACLVCNSKTTKGNKKVCIDGPVFLGRDIYELTS